MKMNSRSAILAVITFASVALTIVPLAWATEIVSFSPEGKVRKVRQVRAAFSESMVALGQPHAASPFEMSCNEPGTALWIDGQNWIFDFKRDLPTKVSCSFTLKANLKSLKGNAMSGANSFKFETGSPVIQEVIPYEGSDFASDQAFLLQFDGALAPSEVIKSTSLVVEGIQSRIPIELLPQKDVAILMADGEFKRFESIIGKTAFFIHAKQNFPANRKLKISFAGDERKFEFQVQPDFKVELNCERENGNAACSPISPIRLNLNAEAESKLADQFRLKDASGKLLAPKAQKNSDSDTRRYIEFVPPFAAGSSYTVIMPPKFADASGRRAVNANRFPLTVKTAPYPPLIKFAANFGILEAADPILPVTVRAVEPELAASYSEVQVLNASANETDFSNWTRRVTSNAYKESVQNASVFDSGERAKLQTLKLPPTTSKKDFEVLGIPLKEPGFYIVEIKSSILGKSLKGKPEPFFVSTAVLVTDLSVHLKIGRERSLVWVTHLSNAKPVGDAEVEVRNCGGTSMFKGKTNSSGFVYVDNLPQTDGRCDNGYKFLASAKKGKDRSFVVDNWDQGIESYRFNLGMDEEARYQTQGNLHTVFDRTLVRAGESIHMKHIARVPTGNGFRYLNGDETPKFVRITHAGSREDFYLPVQFDAGGSTTTDWKIPKAAKLGVYEITFANSENEERKWNEAAAGSFHVEEFKVPLMSAFLSGPKETLISPLKIPLHAGLVYLNGGSASQKQVTIRYQFESDAQVKFPDFNDFAFNSRQVREVTTSRGQRDEGEESEHFDTGYQTVPLTLDKAGSAEYAVDASKGFHTSGQLNVEMEYRDPSGATGTIARHFPIWKSNRFVGMAAIPWDTSHKSVSVRTVVVDLRGKPVAGAPVEVDEFKETYFTYRKRLVGGFFAYDSTRKIEKLRSFCYGTTDKYGLFLCEANPKSEGSLIFQARTKDSLGNETFARQTSYVYGADQDWEPVSDNDRMDLLANAKTIEPGEKAHIQLHMPFRDATALVTVEREGVLDAFVTNVHGTNPEIEVPIKDNYAPNAFVSVLAVRGRVSTPEPTAMVDLGRPSFKLGIQKFKVGWAGHEIKVKVQTDKPVYQTREKAKVKIKVVAPRGHQLEKSAEVAVAVIDEGLLEFMPNKSWDLLTALMRERPYEVATSTAQMNVIGKRHFGKKALAAGGGGGASTSRELFDTLLYWNPHVLVDSSGEAAVDFPVNDSLTKFRVAVVATSGADLFGEAETSFVSTRDLQLLTGLPQILRKGDHVTVQSVVRNTTRKDLKAKVSLQFETSNEDLANAQKAEAQKTAVGGATTASIAGQEKEVSIKAASASEIAWTFDVPAKVGSLKVRSTATADNGLSDSTLQSITILPAKEAHTIQATLTQIGGPGATKNFKDGVDIDRKSVV